MVDLSHWDFAEHFSGYEAAALILGVEPRESGDVEWRVRVVADRMELHYKYALRRMFNSWAGDPAEDLGDREHRRKTELVSVKMDELHRLSLVYTEQTNLDDWIADSRRSKFENQEFSRIVIADWIDAIGMKSAYKYRKSDGQTETERTGHWPWGNHHTEMLGHLEAAAIRFWVQYDPAEPSTANTNATVSDWLHGERKVSRTMADAIASMLRADGLATGPRR